MVSVSRSFDPESLEVLDRVYALACLYIEAQHLCSAAEWDKAKELDAARKAIFDAASDGRIDFDTLCNNVLVISKPGFKDQRSQLGCSPDLESRSEDGIFPAREALGAQP